MTVAYASGKNIASKSVPEVFPPYEAKEVYSRPADWLTLPTVSTTDQKLVGLVAVTDDESNFISLTATTSTGNYQVDWGDGNVESFVGGAQCDHTYTYSSISAGTTTTRGYRQVIITITALTGNLTAFDLNRRPASIAHIITAKWLDIVVGSPYMTSLIVSPSSKICQLTMCESFQIRSTANTFNSFTQAFREMSSLQKFRFPDTMPTTPSNYSGMFYNDYMLYDVSDVPVMKYPLVNGTMADMFNGCKRLRVAPYIDTSKAQNLAGMFGNCVSLQIVPRLPTQNATNMSSMFAYCYSLETAPWMETGLVTSMDSMFINCYSLVSVPAYDTKSVTTMASMFNTCYAIRSIPWFDTSKVVSTGMVSMFQNCTSLESIPLLDTGNITSLSNTFNNCKSLVTIPLLNTSKVTDMTSTFSTSSSLVTIPLIDTSNVTTFNSTFSGCNALSTISSINTSKSTVFTSMFSGCNSLKSVPLLDTGNATATNNMFLNCYNLTEVPLFNLANNLNATSMFSTCTSLMTVPAFNMTKTTTVGTMFNTCTNLNSVPSMNLANAVTGTTTMMASCQTLATILPTGLKTAFSVTGCNMSKNALEAMMNELAGNATSQTLTITSNYGADAGASTNLVASQASGSTTLNVTSSTNFAIGQWVVNSVAFGATAIGFTTGTNICSKTNHGLANGTRVSFPTVGTSGLIANQIYYVVNRTTNDFQLSLTQGGSVVTILATSTGTMRYEVYCTGKPNSTSITVSAPTTATTTATAITGRQINTYLALLKNWTVTG